MDKLNYYRPTLGIKLWMSVGKSPLVLEKHKKIKLLLEMSPIAFYGLGAFLKTRFQDRVDMRPHITT